jgi:hypothetical protein
MKVLIIHPRDICFDDLEALVFAYENERQGSTDRVAVGSPPDHFLAYLLLQSVELPLSRRLEAIGKLNVDQGFFDWVADTYGSSCLAERRRPLPGERFKEDASAQSGRFSVLQRDVLHALDSIEARSQKSMRLQAGVPPLALEQLASGIIDYHDPLKAYVDATADFLNLLHEMEHEMGEGGGREVSPEKHRPARRRKTGLASAVRAFRTALEGIARVAGEPPVTRLSCAGEGNSVGSLPEKLRLAKELLGDLLKEREDEDESRTKGDEPRTKEDESRTKEDETRTKEEVKRLTEAVTGIHDTLIHDHSHNSALAGDRELSIHVLDANVCRVGSEIARTIDPDLAAETFVMISAMSAEQAMGAAMGRALELLGVPARQIAYGGMSLNAFVPRNLKSIPQAFNSADIRAGIERRAEGIFGKEHRPSLFFGFFDRPGARVFLDGFLRGKRTLGHGTRMAQDGFWLDAVKSRFVQWHGKYVSSALGIPFADAYRPLMIQGSCRYNCDFCASLGSMALGNQRTAEDVFSQIKYLFREMAWVGSNLGPAAEALKDRPFFRDLFAGANLLCGGNLMIVDDNLSNVHPWTLKLLCDYLQAEGIVPAVWSQMDVNAMEQPEHREFIRRYVVSAFVGLEAVRDGYLLGFKKKAAALAKKALGARTERAGDADEKALGARTERAGDADEAREAIDDEDASLLRYLEEMKRGGESDPLRQTYLVNLSRLADAGAIPLHALLIGMPGHMDAVRVANEIVDFVDNPIEKFNIRAIQWHEKKLLNLASKLPFMTYQANYFSIFAGSPDWVRFYPQGDPDGSLLSTLRAFVVSGYAEYDSSRMGGNFTQINQNAYRLVMRLLKDRKEYQALERFEPEDGALAHYHVDRELSRMSELLKAFFGCLVVTYVGKRHLAPLSAVRLLQAYKSTIIMTAFRACGSSNAQGLAGILPVARWTMYRRYVAHRADPAEIEKAADLLQRFGFLVEDGNRIRMAPLDGYAEGFPEDVYRANGIRDNALGYIDMNRIASSYFEAIVGYLVPG